MIKAERRNMYMHINNGVWWIIEYRIYMTNTVVAVITICGKYTHSWVICFTSQSQNIAPTVLHSPPSVHHNTDHNMFSYNAQVIAHDGSNPGHSFTQTFVHPIIHFPLVYAGVVNQRVNECPPPAKVKGERMSGWTIVRIPNGSTLGLQLWTLIYPFNTTCFCLYNILYQDISFANTRNCQAFKWMPDTFNQYRVVCFVGPYLMAQFNFREETVQI